MEGSGQDQEFGARVALRVASEPAFAALDTSGAPIIVAAGEPLAIVYMNDTARALFGEDVTALANRLFRRDQPAGRRLTQLVDSVRVSSALRLERLRLEIDSAPQSVTVLCRRLAAEGEAPCFAIAALGVRAAPAEKLASRAPATPIPEAPGPAPRASDPRPSAARQSGSPNLAHPNLADAGLAVGLAERHGARAPRFLWKTDARGRFTDVTHVLADVVGEARADILGRSVEDVSALFGFGSAIVKAVASGKSWSGIEVDWPLDDTGAVAPVTLGALPVMDSAHRFQGFQGYGVLHLDRVRNAADGGHHAAASGSAAPEPPRIDDEPAPEPFIAEAAPPPRETDEPAVEPPPLVKYPDNIVRLRPPSARLIEPDPAPEEAEDQSSLTTTELSAFDEIARALKNGAPIDPTPADGADEDAVEDAADARPDSPAQESASEKESAPEKMPARALEPILDRLPVGVLVARGAETLFVNRTLLDYLGYADRDAFDRDGGLARMFFGRAPAAAQPPAPRPVAVQASDGEALDADAHLQIIDWDGAPATLLTLRRNRFQPQPGPHETVLALARALEEKLARARAEAALFETAFERAEATAILADDGRVERVNGAFAMRAGLDRATIEHHNISGLLIAESSRALLERLTHFDRDRSVLRLTLRGRIGALDARLQRLDSRRIALTLSEPAPRGADEHEAARVAAEHASAAKSDFLARISHEIRTPLNAIIGFAELMMEERFGPIGSERYKEYLKDIHGSGSHVLSLVNDLLDLSKIEAGKMELAFERVDANAVIAECASIMQTQANKNRVVMRLALAPQLPSIRADARALKQILLNLFSNAVKFNEPGGQVIASTALTESGCVVIRVKDTGIGMSDDEVQTALQPFKQVATTREATTRQRGTGLGLPLTKALIEANHASFTIKSRKNEGTLIEIAFPPPQVLAAE